MVLNKQTYKHTKKQKQKNWRSIRLKKFHNFLIILFASDIDMHCYFQIYCNNYFISPLKKIFKYNFSKLSRILSNEISNTTRRLYKASDTGPQGGSYVIYLAPPGLLFLFIFNFELKG